RAHRGDCAARGNQSDAVARVQRELIGEPAPDRDPLPFVKALERSLPDVVGDGWELDEIRGAHAAQEHAGGAERRRCKCLPFHDRRGKLDAFDMPDAIGHLAPVRKRGFEGLNQKRPVKAEYLVEQLLAKSVHHRHHDDERRNAEHDAKKRESRIDRDESFLPACAQIPQRQQPFEWSKGMRAARLAHWISSPGYDSSKLEGLRMARFWPFHALI